MKEQLIAAWEMSKGAIYRTYQVVKVSAILAVDGLTLIGGYVVTNADLRDSVIDFAKNQHVEEVKAEGLPKE